MRFENGYKIWRADGTELVLGCSKKKGDDVCKNCEFCEIYENYLAMYRSK
jgi:hypothetical protein